LRRSAGRTLALLLLAALTFSISQTTMNPAITVIEADFHAAQTTVAWTLGGFFIMAALAPSIVGRLGDMFGKKRMLVVELAVFSAGATVCALAPNVYLLIAGRVVMGAGAGIFLLAFSIVRDELEPDRVASGVGVVAAMVGVGVALGFPLGGLMIEHLGLASIFWQTAVMAVIVAVAVGLLVPESTVRRPGRVDVAGAALLAVGLVLLLTAISRASDWGWIAEATLGLAAAGAVVLVLFVRYELARPQPMINVRLLGSRPVFTNNVAGFLLGFGGIGAFVLIPLLAQMPRSTGYGLGVSPGESGFFLVPSALLTILAAAVSGRFMTRLGSRNVLVVGALLTSGSIAILAAAHGSSVLVALWPAFFGFGTGLAYAALPMVAVESVPQDATGEATGVNTVLRNAGLGVGVQVITTILATNVIAGTGFTSDAGYTVAFAVCAAGSLLAAVAACFIPLHPRFAVA
jgi:MFS family permease